MELDKVLRCEAASLEAHSPLGDEQIAFIDLAETGAERRARRLAGAPLRLIVGVDHAGLTPDVDVGLFDLLITARSEPPAPWAGAGPGGLQGRLRQLHAVVAGSPLAAAALGQVLRIGERLDFTEALAVESLAYSALLGGAEFRAWLRNRRPTAATPSAEARVGYGREGDVVTLTLDRPAARNAVSAALRDALCEALAAVLEDPTEPQLVLRGAGACFSVGGDLAEFGTAHDLALAHAIRTLRSPVALLYALGSRATVVMHGACIGAGAEMGAAAAKRVAHPSAFFQLPELAMGLIPGAGGTATLSRAIGRHRTAFLALTGRRIGAATAHQWGLVHEVMA